MLQWGVWGVAMAIVMAWLGRNRLRARTDEPGEMRMPASIFVVMAICLLFFSTAIALQIAIPNKTVTWWTIGIFLVLSAMCLPVISAFFLEKHRLSAEGMAFRNFAGVRKTVSWTDLRSVRYSAAMKWFRLETRSGTVARISVALTGLPEFARLVLQKAPPGTIEADSLPVLEATANGHPPSLYR